MTGKFEHMKPAVGKSALLIAAALLWIAAGVLLLTFAYTWLHHGTAHASVYAGIGILAALLIHHFGFLKIADKNLVRILPMEGKRCLFAFMSWKSYILVVVMAALGFALRHSPVPKPYLAAVYIAIGMALVLSSMRYLQQLWRMHDEA